MKTMHLFIFSPHGMIIRFEFDKNKEGNIHKKRSTKDKDGQTDKVRFLEREKKKESKGYDKYKKDK